MTKTARAIVGIGVLWAGAVCWSQPVAYAQRPQRDPLMRIWGGVYIDAQAERGKAAFSASCGSCHSADLSGGSGPALAGPKFMTRWELESLTKMFRQIKDNMPRNSPGSLSDAAVVDLMAYILKTNGFPAGTTPATTLTPNEDALDAIVFVAQSGPTKAPNFALVQVAGCLSQRADKTWALTEASDPASTKDVPITDADLKESGRKVPGTQTFKLVSAGPFAPDTHVGQTVAVKGIINRVQPDALLNVTALEALGGRCGN